MENTDHRIIDSHVHLDHIYEKKPERIRWMQEHGIMPISWAFGLHIENVGNLKDYLRTQSEVIHGLNREGFECYYLSGIHPRNISPDLGSGDVRDILSPFLDDPLCLGIGEIGLETGSNQEKEILCAHLELAESMDKKLGIHTPRNDKPRITEEILAVLKSYPGIEDITVIDHCTPETVGQVLERGYWAGVTLSPLKTSFQDLEQIIRQHSENSERIMCNTDSGTVFYEDIYQLYASEAFPPTIRKGLAFANASRFFLLP
ncbi:TatD family hydrolase [Desulfococcaceae bacterium HSG8]|nr:TatD family hydrolase [Desulfococcaceae bacterium HSG8]